MTMSEWDRNLYEDPCRECGFSWSISQADAASLVASIPMRYSELLDGRDASLRHPDLSWPVGAYVCHVADNMRIWAERLAGLALGATDPIDPYDQDDLARVRNYSRVPLEAGLWSLRHAVADWRDAVELATDRQVVMEHPERGSLSVLEVVRSIAHDAHHHAWDIQRSIDRSGA